MWYNFNPQTVYNKDLSGCNFSVSKENANNYIFSYSTDFTNVNLRGTNINHPYIIFLNSTIYKSYIDKRTILPKFYADNADNIEFIEDDRVKKKIYTN